MATPRQSGSHVISARLSAKQFRAATRLFARRNLSPSAYTRRVFQALADGDQAAARALLDDLLAAVGLPPDAPREDVLAKLEELYDQIGDEDEVPSADDDALDEGPDLEPAEPFKRKAARLTDRERAECAKRGVTPAAFLKAKAAAARRTAAPKAKPSKPAPVKLSAADREHCRRRRIDPEDFLKRKREAARRR